MMAVASFAELVAALEPFRGGRWVYRGVHNPAHLLVPSVGRTRAVDRELTLFEEFKRDLPAYSSAAPTDDWEVMAVGQHHGLPTRMLDWTENPLCAAHFACDRHFDRDGVVYAMNCPWVTREADLRTGPFAITRVQRYRPRHVSPRIRAQSGLFTVHPRPADALAVGAHDGLEIEAIRIDASYKEQLLWDLAKFGVHRASLFPDADGLARYLRWMYETYDATKSPPRKRPKGASRTSPGPKTNA